MTVLFFLIAVICMVVGHIFKVKRWGLLISVYEEPSEPNLLNAMTFGHTINAIFPFRIGDIIRFLWAGRKLKNGQSLSLATVIVDLYIDLITVGAMFVGLSIIGKGGAKLQEMAAFYRNVFIVVIPLTVVCFFCRRIIKRIIRGVASIFNEIIELRILYVSYLCIASLKDITKKINKVKFVILTVGIWFFYVASYVIFAESVQRHGYYYSTSDVFTELFSYQSFYHIERGLIPFWGAYLLLPLAVCWCISMLLIHSKTNNTIGGRTVLPQMNRSDRLAFLQTYYEDEKREHIQAYLDINRDVTIVEDNSAGSNASTVLAMKPDGEMIYRKYAFDYDGVKLKEQIEWIEMHQEDIPLPVIVSQRIQNNYTTYDMHSYANTVGLFRYIHTMPVEYSWNTLEKALEDISSGIHKKNVRRADLEIIKKYVQSKVCKNIGIIVNEDKYIKALEQYDYIYTNGRKLKTLKCYKYLLSEQHLLEVFKDDMYSDIHGDLTIENIVCVGDEAEIDDAEYAGKVKPHTYYFIDPNTGNVHDSPYLDYAKLLQSLHGCYEFLMMVSKVEIDKNKVSYLMINSENYKKIYEMYRNYLMRKYSRNQVVSIYYHEVIHWLRLMPYKIHKNEKLAVVFYTGLLNVLNDTWELENGKEK